MISENLLISLRCLQCYDYNLLFFSYYNGFFYEYQHENPFYYFFKLSRPYPGNK